MYATLTCHDAKGNKAMTKQLNGEILQKKRWKQDNNCWVILVQLNDNKATPFVRWIVG